MKIVVQKYGGSSVSSLEKIEIIAQRLVQKQNEGWRVVVVVSAMGNSTDELLNLAREIVEQPPARELDMLLSTGERTTMALLSIAIQKYGAQAISFTGSQSGIVTNDSHARAKIISVRPYRIEDELERGKIVIVAGYQGTSYKSEITTLGRGGSDMTAIALAGALGAQACEIYSDVDGVYTADPKLVLDAQRIDTISASEMLLLAQQGAKVLHDEAIAYARKHGIALYAKSTLQPHSGGSFIRPDGWPEYALKDAEIKPVAIASAKQILFFRSVANDCIAVMKAIETYKECIKILSIHKGWQECSAILDVWNSVSPEAIVDKIMQNASGAAYCSLDYANISLVGQDIGREFDIVQKALKLLDSIGVQLIYYDVQANALNFVLARTELVQASNALHTMIV
ncbi:MAG: aspartate kinase [Bradymonadia bacterium]